MVLSLFWKIILFAAINWVHKSNNIMKIFANTLRCLFVMLSLQLYNVKSIGNNENRYSFSLTTFSPTGKLQQVEYASLAATTLGTPILAAITSSNKIILCAQHSVPTPLICDDGTRRFCSICPGIAITHSGLSADGRAVISAAQRLAIEHEYTFDEDIPIQIFLEEVSLLFQKYTMKAGTRPFGCSVLVADCTGDMPSIYKIGPSGAVEKMGTVAVLGTGLNEGHVTKLLEQEKFSEQDNNEATSLLVKVLEKNIFDNMAKKPAELLTKGTMPKLSFLTASLARNECVVTNSTYSCK